MAERATQDRKGLTFKPGKDPMRPASNFQSINLLSNCGGHELD